MRTTNDFNKAPVGTPALCVCACCRQPTGEVLIKMRGLGNDRLQYTGPSHVAMEGEYCEFCQFVAMYKQSEGYEGRVAAGKIVEGAEQKLVAFVPFLEDEDIKEIKVGEEMVPRVHGLVIRAERAEEGKMMLVEVLERGAPCDDGEESPFFSSPEA